MKTEKKTGKKTVYISRYLIAQYREHITQTLQKYIAFSDMFTILGY